MNGLDPLFGTVLTLPVGSNPQRIQFSLRKSSRDTSEEHSTLKIPMSYTLSSFRQLTRAFGKYVLDSYLQVQNFKIYFMQQALLVPIRQPQFRVVLILHSSFMERTLFIPSFFLKKTFPSLYLVWSQAWKLKYRSSLLTVLLLCVVLCLVPTRPAVMESLTTSRSLWTVTNSSFHEVFVDVFSTSLWLACGKVVYSYCL